MKWANIYKEWDIENNRNECPLTLLTYVQSSEQEGESLSLKLLGLVRKYAMTYGTPGYIVYSFVYTDTKYTG